MIRVVLASKLRVLREGIKRILLAQDDINVIAEVAHVGELVPSEEIPQLDGVILIAVPAMGEGNDYLFHLRKRNPALQVIIVARSPTPQQVLSILRAGVRGLLSASCAASHLLTAVRTVSCGRLYMHDEVAKLVAAGVDKIAKDRTHRSLTQREFEIFVKLANGHKVSEIASHLGISVKTVSTHKSRLMEKMDMRSHSQIIQYAVANSLFDAPRPD